MLISNTSNYLMHYRLLLINELKKTFNELIIISPADRSSIELTKKAKFINWGLSRTNEYSFLNLIKSFFELLLM